MASPPPIRMNNKGNHSAMSSTTEQQVALKEQVGVFISCFTAWVYGDGLLNFKEYIYGHYKKMASIYLKLPNK